MKTLLIMIALNMMAYSQVTEEWVTRYNGPGWLGDSAVDIALDASGNIYVTGSSHNGGSSYIDIATIKYDAWGNVQWIARYVNPQNSGYAVGVGVVVDNSGNVYVAGDVWNGDTYYDFIMIKYDSAGEEQWVKTYNGPGNGHEYAVAAAIDNQSNVYIVGRSNGAGGVGSRYDYATIKYNTNGDQLWVARYEGPSGVNANFGDEPAAITVDNFGNVYVTGRSQNEGVSFSLSYATIKYNSSGVQQWVQRYNLHEMSWGSEATSITLDETGNIYVTGKSDRGDAHFDYATIKYNSNGVEQWVRRYPGSGSGNTSEPVSVKVDNSENVFVTGTTFVQDYAFATIKYNSAGEEQWTAIYGAPNSQGNYAKTMAIDADGNVYVTGSTITAGNNIDIATIKYNSSGALQWEILYDGSGIGVDQVYGIAVNNSGDVYITGSSWIEIPDFDARNEYITIKYTQALLNTLSNLNIPINNTSPAVSTMNFSLPGDISFNNFSNANVRSVEVRMNEVLHTRTGDLTFTLERHGVIDTLIYEVGGSGENFINTVLTDFAETPIENGEAPFTGQYKPYKPLSIFDGMDPYGDWTLTIIDGYPDNDGILNSWSLKIYVDSPTSMNDINRSIPIGYLLYQNYPNPFNAITVIEYRLPLSGNVILKVYDVIGREVATLIEEFKSSGSYQVEFNANNLPSGVYFYRLSVGNEFTQTKKFVLLK